MDRQMERTIGRYIDIRMQSATRMIVFLSHACGILCARRGLAPSHDMLDSASRLFISSQAAPRLDRPTVENPTP